MITHFDVVQRRRVPVRALAFVLLLAAASAFATDGDKACQSAKRKVEREQKSLAALTEAIAHDKQARESCQSRTVCARYDVAIADGERRATRLASRLSRYEEEAAAACG